MNAVSYVFASKLVISRGKYKLDCVMQGRLIKSLIYLGTKIS